MRRLNFLALVAVLLLGVSGCNVIGYAAHALEQPTTVPPAYVLGAEPTLLVVENAQQPQVGEIAADQLRGFVLEDLKRSSTAVIVERFEALTFDMAVPQQSLREMGEAAGATRVVYVDLRLLRVAAITGTDSYVGRGEANVKVLDVTTGKIVFPTTQSGGIPITAQTEREPFQNTRPDVVRIQALKLLATNVARLFYEYKIDPDDN